MLIDPYEYDWLDRLDSFAARNAPSEHTHLLLDGAFIPGMHKQFARALPEGGQPKFLFQNLPGWRKAVRDVSPFIVQFDKTNSPLKKLLSECSGWPMLAAIGTSETLESAAQRLSRWCVVRAGGQHINLRFPDTRRLPDILSVLTDEQRADMFGPAKSCAFIARDGIWAQIELDGNVPPPKGEPELTDTQFDHLISCSEGDSILTQLENRSMLPPGISRSTQFNNVCKAITLGKAQKLERRDLLGWCEFSLANTASKQAMPDLFAAWCSEQTTNQVG